MLDTEHPSAGLLFFSFLYRADLFTHDFFAQKIEALWGPCISHVPEFNPLSAYYAKEMGEASLLKRIFFISTKSFPREFLLTTKLLSLTWEREWAKGQGRMVNVDLGFITPENFILATTKNYAHRIFLGQKIFADLTYQCLDGGYQILPWTYPDYRDPSKIDFLNWCRSYLLMHSKV